MTVPAFRQLRHVISLLNNFCIFYYFAIYFIDVYYACSQSKHFQFNFVHFLSRVRVQSYTECYICIAIPSVRLSVRRILVFLFYEYCGRLHEKPALVTNTCWFKRRSILLCNRRRYAFKNFLSV